MTTTEKKGVRVRCPLGGTAPCIDDLCHSGGTLLCGLDPDFDVCPHGFIPETCPEYSCDEDRADDDWPEDDFDDDGHYRGG